MDWDCTEKVSDASTYVVPTNSCREYLEIMAYPFHSTSTGLIIQNILPGTRDIPHGLYYILFYMVKYVHRFSTIQISRC